MKLITKPIEMRLRKNSAETMDTGEGANQKPVLKLFNPCGSGTWLFTELDEDGRLFGLCDPGLGFPELGYASLEEIESVRLPFGLKIERDRSFKARATISEYADKARVAGHIVEYF